METTRKKRFLIREKNGYTNRQVSYKADVQWSQYTNWEEEKYQNQSKIMELYICLKIDIYIVKSVKAWPTTQRTKYLCKRNLENIESDHYMKYMNSSQKSTFFFI